MPPRDIHETEPRRRLEEAVAETIDVAGDDVREAAELLVSQLVHEWGEVSETRARTEAASRYFLELSPEWEALLEGPPVEPEALVKFVELLRGELLLRVPGTERALRNAISHRLREIAPELLAEMRSAGAVQAPHRTKHHICAMAWRDVLARNIECLVTPVTETWDGKRLSDKAEHGAAQILHFMRFVELVDLRSPAGVEVLREAAAGVPSRPSASVFDPDHGKGKPKPDRDRSGKVKTRVRKPRRSSTLKAADEAALELAASRLRPAVAEALRALEADRSPYVDALDRMAKGDLTSVPESKRTRAYHALGRKLHAAGFAYGTPIEDPNALLGARHVFPVGTLPKVSLPSELAAVLRCEWQGKTLKETAGTLGYPWPGASAAAAEWDGIGELLAELREARRMAREDRRARLQERPERLHWAIFEGDPFSRLPHALPKHFARAKSQARRADNAPPLFEYGRVLLMPDDAVGIEALARRQKRQREILPSPLNKTHVGHWYFFPRNLERRELADD